MANLFPNDDANALVPNFNIEFVPNPGHAHFANNNNNNGWIEWDVPLGEMDEPMVDSESDEEETDDEDDDGVGTTIIIFQNVPAWHMGYAVSSLKIRR
ncbi:hypothetical protein Tco_0855855 [Tanacetum coccineum]